MFRTPLCHFQCPQIYALQQMPWNHSAIFFISPICSATNTYKTIVPFCHSQISAVRINMLQMVLFSLFLRYCSRKCVCNHFLLFSIPSYLRSVSSARQYMNDSVYNFFDTAFLYTARQLPIINMGHPF